MSSRDGSGRSGGYDRSSNQRRTPGNPSGRQQRPRESWDIDPAEIDRYLSGRPTREQEAVDDGRGRRQQEQGTRDQLDQFQRQRRQVSRSERPSRSASAGRQQFVEPDDYPEYDDYGQYDDADDFAGDYDDEPYVDPPPTRPQRRRATREPARRPLYQEDDELYADDPYLIYDDDYAEPAPAPTRRRQRPQATRPSLPAMPKITVPKAITQAEVLNDITSLSLIVAAVLSIAIMSIVVSNRIDNLPAIIPTHVSASGVGEALKGRNALWSVPLLASALSLMNVAAAWFLARMDLFAARFLLGASLLVQFIAWIAVFKYLW